MKKYYYFLLVISLIAAVLAFIIVLIQKPTYQSSGKFSVIKNSDSNEIKNDNILDVTLYNSVAESIKSREFVKTLYSASGISYKEADLEDLDNFIKVGVVSNSNVIQIDLINKDKDALDALGSNFNNTVKQSGVLQSQKSKLELRVIDPMYTLPNAISLSPLKVSLIVFVAMYILGLLIAYTFYLPEYNKYLAD